MHGCRALGHQVLTLEFGPIWQLYSREPRLKPQLANDITELVAAFIRSNDIHLSVSMWANSILTLSAYQRGAEVVSLFDVIERPHLLLWLDSPERARDGGVPNGGPACAGPTIRKCRSCGAASCAFRRRSGSRGRSEGRIPTGDTGVELESQSGGTGVSPVSFTGGTPVLP